MTRPTIDIIERLRFDATRCEVQFSKGVASNIEEGAAEIERLRAALLHIKTMDVYTRGDDPTPAHEIMRCIAEKALGNEQNADKEHAEAVLDDAIDQLTGRK